MLRDIGLGRARIGIPPTGNRSGHRDPGLASIPLRRRPGEGRRRVELCLEPKRPCNIAELSPKLRFRPASGVAEEEQLLSQLSEEKREVLVLSELEEMTVPEIAELLDANVNTIYARLRTARQEFERLYARHQRRTP